MRKLQKEVESLRQMIEDQETEIDQLKARLSEMETPKRKPAPKKPPR
jgi:cell division protein FtsL